MAELISYAGCTGMARFLFETGRRLIELASSVLDRSSPRSPDEMLAAERECQRIGASLADILIARDIPLVPVPWNVL